MSNVFLNPPVTQVVSIATTLTSAQSGALVPLDLSGAANFAITLPTAQLGLNYKFYVATAGARNCTVNGTFNGYLIGAVTRVACAGKAGIVITGAGGLALVGDTLEIFCDGTNWVARGFAQTAGALA